MTIVEEIKRLSDAKGYSTQKELADAAGISQSFVARLFRNDRPNLTAEVLYKLCDALGVGCDHFRPFLSDSPAATPPAPAKKRKK